MLIRYRDGRFISFTSEHGLPAVNTLRLDVSADGRLWITSLANVTSFDGERAVSYVAADFPALAADQSLRSARRLVEPRPRADSTCSSMGR